MFHYPVPSQAPALPETEELLDPQQSLRQHLRLGLAVLGAMLACLFAAATIVTIAGSVVGAGEVVTTAKVQTLSHPTGGVIAAILVKDGDRVQASDPLIRFDTTIAGVDASTSEMSLDQLLAQKARLLAERDGHAVLAFPPALATSAASSAREAVAGERRLFTLRRAALAGEQAQLNERIGQLRQQIAGYEAQITANRQQSALIAPERQGVRALWERKLVTINRLNELERTAVSLDGAVAALQTDIAQARAGIAEIRQQSIQLIQQQRSSAATQLAEVEQRLTSQRLRVASATDSYDRTVLRASASGIIDQLAYTTPGAVIPAAQPILRIVPDKGGMTVEARIAPIDIDRLHRGETARVTFSAFDRKTSPSLDGILDYVSAERVDEPQTGRSYYRAKIVISPADLHKLGGLKLVPGMPAEVYIRTGQRSLLSYLTKPFADQLARAFREN